MQNKNITPNYDWGEFVSIPNSTEDIYYNLNCPWGWYGAGAKTCD